DDPATRVGGSPVREDGLVLPFGVVADQPLVVNLVVFVPKTEGDDLVLRSDKLLPHVGHGELPANPGWQVGGLGDLRVLPGDDSDAVLRDCEAHAAPSFAHSGTGFAALAAR